MDMRMLEHGCARRRKRRGIEVEAERRRQLEERRRFMRERTSARRQREEIEPAWSALEAAGETFRIYYRGDTPRWSPRWIPAGYSYIPWHELDGVTFAPPIRDRAHMAGLMRDLLAERLAPDDDLLFIPQGKGWSVGLTAGGFDRHAEVLLDAAWDSVYLAAPPAQWLICGDWAKLMWKDG
jgi:hypothetical protein